MNAVETEPLLRKTPDVVGGAACIRRSRIAVYDLVEWRQLGRTDVDLLNDYPTLTQEDLNAAWAYYADHRDEIDTEIRLNNEAE